MRIPPDTREFPRSMVYTDATMKSLLKMKDCLRVAILSSFLKSSRVRTMLSIEDVQQAHRLIGKNAAVALEKTDQVALAFCMNFLEVWFMLIPP